MMKTMRLVAVAALVSMCITGCGGNQIKATPSDSAAAATATSLKQVVLEKAKSGGYPFKDTQATCYANSVVNTFHLDQLKSWGLVAANNTATSKDVSDAGLNLSQATAIINLLIDCVGPVSFVATMRGKLLANTTPAQRTCAEKLITLDAARRLTASAFSNDQTKMADLSAAFKKCD